MKKSALAFIFITLVIDCIGIGIIIPVMAGLIKEITGLPTSEASAYGGYLGFTYAFMQFIFSPVMGNLSDQYGRRPVLLFSLLGLGIDYIFLAFAPSIFWLFIGRAIAGVTGASFTTGMAYIADISSPEKRAANFGLVGAAFGLGFILGPIIGGFAAAYFESLKAPFLVAASLSILNLLFGYFFLPESLLAENRRKFSWKRANAWGTLMQIRKYPAITIYLVALCLLFLAGNTMQSTWGFFTIERFNWDEKQIAISLTIVGVMAALVQGFLVKYAIPYFGQVNTVLVGVGLQIVGFTLFSLASQEWMMYAFTIVYCLGGICGPALQGLISTGVPANEQGEIQGTVTAVMSIASIISPLMMTQIFSYFTTSKTDGHYFPGAAFITAAAIEVIIIAILLTNRKKKLA